MAIPSRMLDRALVLSKLKQAAYGTVLTDVNLQAGKRFPPNTPVFGQPMPKFFTDRGRSMRSTDFTIQRIETERDYTEQITFDGDTWLLAWAHAFAMGAVTSSQPNAGGNPTCYKHVIKPLDPSSAGKDLPYTTIYAEAAGAANLSRRLIGCAVKDVTVEFPQSAPIRVSVTIQGSGQSSSGVLSSQPSMATMNLLLSNNLQVLYGAQGGPADISSQIVPGSVKFSFTWNPDDSNSRAPGAGLYRSRLWVGQNPAINLQFQRYVDDAASTPNDDWLAGTVQEVQVNVPGAQIGPGPETHLFGVRGLAVVPEVLKVGQAGDKTIYDYTIGPDHWIKQGSNDVVVATVQNLETSYFV